MATKKRKPPTKNRQAAVGSQPDSPLELGTLVEWVNETDTATSDSRMWSERCRDYYDSKQWSDSEARALKARNQAPTVINRIKPKMDGLMGMERANRTTAKAYPRTPKEAGGAEAATEAVRYVLDANFYRTLRSEAFDNMLVEGTGGMEVIVRPYGNDYKIVINRIPWDRLLYDPHARRKDFSDARYLGQVVWMDYDEAAEIYSNAQDILDSMLDGSTTYGDKPSWIDTNRHRVKIIELYFKYQGDVWYGCFTYGGFLKKRGDNGEVPRKSPYKNDVGETEWPYEFQSLFVDREGNRYGHALQYLDVQDEINKRRSKALHLMSVRQVRWERGAVDDINQARQELAKPDGVIETTPGMEFEVLKTGDMAAAQFNLLTEAKNEIDAVGYNAAASGKETRSMSGIALKSRQLAGETELAPMFDALRHLDIRVYRKIWGRVRQYWKKEKWIRVTDDQANLRWVGLNQPMTKMQLALEEAQKRGANPQQLQMLQQQLAQDPSANQIADTRNDIVQMDVDIVMDDAPDSVTVQQEEFTALSEMVKSRIPIPPTAIVQASNLKDKDKIIKDMKAGAQIPPEVQDQIKKMQEQLQQFAQENQKLKADQQGEMLKLQQKAEQSQRDAEIQATAAGAEHDRETQRIQLEDKRKREQVQMDANFQVWAARLKADTAITVARITKGQSGPALDEAGRDAAEGISEANQGPMTSSEAEMLQQKHIDAMLAALEKLTASVDQLNQNQTAQSSGTRTFSIGQIHRDEQGNMVGADIHHTLQ